MFSRIYLIINALSIGGIGIAYLIDPNFLFANYGLESGSVSMDNMLRASYGGIFVALAIIISFGIFNQKRKGDMLLLTAMVMTGAAIGRLMSIFFMGEPNAPIYMLLGYELVAGLIGFILFSKKQSA